MNSISTEIRHSQNRAQDFADLEYRRKFMKLTDKDCASIRLIKDIIDRELPVALDIFYEQVRKTPETSAFFPTEAKKLHMQKMPSSSTGKIFPPQISIRNMRKRFILLVVCMHGLAWNPVGTLAATPLLWII
ncbi:hypothetical protein GOB86_12195 [Acetobacter lambici]|uniref:protoglobin domain-containing protein n=1 Tax=Acetobacter lambici TaxID=1332824 RepID=UPI00140C976E|nr:protoglobin domain-containing protein [Acetobacter lambici]NHO57804.1 hypothetical protein [Acetobacter lambici]